MTDIIDRGSEREEFDREVAIHQRRPRGPVPNGECAICGRPVPVGAQFCDAECREDWEREQKRFPKCR